MVVVMLHACLYSPPSLRVPSLFPVFLPYSGTRLHIVDIEIVWGTDFSHQTLCCHAVTPVLLCSSCRLLWFCLPCTKLSVFSDQV